MSPRKREGRRGKAQKREVRRPVSKKYVKQISSALDSLSSTVLVEPFIASTPPAFEPFFEPSAMQTRSRAAVLPLLAGLFLLCSVTRAQVSYFSPHWKSRR